MKTFFYAAVFSLTSLAICSCEEKAEKTESTTTDTSNMQHDTSMTTPITPDTSAQVPAAPVTDSTVKEFVADAAHEGMMETEMGQMGAESGNNARVKDLGATMASDHMAAASELKKMAAANSITIPDKPMKDDGMQMMKGAKMKGAAFDKMYINKMVKDHEKMIAKFKKAATSLKDPAYKAYAEKMIPVLQKHLDSAKAIQQQMQ